MKIADAEETALWFMNHMTMEQRHKLMSERPLLYKRLYPSVPAARILEVVSEEIR